MAKSGAYIRDVHALEELEERIGRCGEAMSSIDADVASYLNEMRKHLQRQLDFIRERLNDAQQRLSMAEAALSACEASQSAASAMGMIGPSCAIEAQEVEMARMEVEKWRMRCDQGGQIMSECDHEVDEFSGSRGGHSLVLRMCDEQTPKATKLLHGCIERLQDILETDVASAAAESKIPSNDSRFDTFRKNIKGEKNF